VDDQDRMTLRTCSASGLLLQKVNTKNPHLLSD